MNNLRKSTDANSGDPLVEGQAYELSVNVTETHQDLVTGDELNFPVYIKGLQATVMQIDTDSNEIVFNSFSYSGDFKFITARKL